MTAISLLSPGPRAFATVALAPSRAAAAPIVRGLLSRMASAREVELEGKSYLVASYTDELADLLALAKVFGAGYGMRTLLFEVNGQTFTGANASQNERWINCFIQANSLGQGKSDCPSVAQNVSVNRYLDTAPRLNWKVGCRCLGAYAGGTVDPSGGKPVPAQLDALAARLGIIACPWFTGASPVREPDMSRVGRY